jgi:hypothetical protein
MVDITSTINLMERRFSVIGFDQNGDPVIEERIMQNLRFAIPPYKVVIVYANNTVTEENINRVLSVLKDYDGFSTLKLLPIDLSLMSKFAERIIYFQPGYKIKHKEEFAKFKNIKYLYIAKNCFNDLRHLKRLREFFVSNTDCSQLKLGTLVDIQHIHFANCSRLESLCFPQNIPLRFLGLSHDRHTESVDFIRDMDKLEVIGLNSVSQLRHWPDSSNLKNLFCVSMDLVHQLTDFSGLVKAPKLEYIRLSNRGKTSEKSLEQLLECRSLKKIWVHAVSKRQEKRFIEILGNKYLDDSKDTWPYGGKIYFE